MCLIKKLCSKCDNSGDSYYCIALHLLGPQVEVSASVSLILQGFESLGLEIKSESVLTAVIVLRLDIMSHTIFKRSATKSCGEPQRLIGYISHSSRHSIQLCQATHEVRNNHFRGGGVVSGTLQRYDSFRELPFG